jgi:alpha-tubulin suppressor-like RCC1 family protein
MNLYIPKLIPSLNNIIQISASYSFSIVLNKFGKVYSFGLNSYYALGNGVNENTLVPVLVPTLDNIVEISSKGPFTYVLDNKNKYSSFGNNNVN